MARRAHRVARALLGAVAAAAFASQANAQTLARLHVRQFALSADASNVAVGQPFHITLTVHLDEPVGVLENVQAPNLAGFQDLGDERGCSFSGKASECFERLTIDANNPGTATLGPFTMEFTDPATGKSRTIESNLVTIHVTGTAKLPPSGADQTEYTNQFLWSVGELLLTGAVTLAAVALLFWFIVWGSRRRTIVAPPPEAPPPPVTVLEAAPPLAWHERMRELGEQLAREPTRARALAVRAELREHVGAGERETIADLMRRGAHGSDDRVMPALAAVERAAFCEDAHVADAAREAVPFLMR